MDFPQDFKCIRCNHPNSQHFEGEDSIGYFAFCMLEKCECLIEDKNDKKNK